MIRNGAKRYPGSRQKQKKELELGVSGGLDTVNTHALNPGSFFIATNVEKEEGTVMYKRKGFEKKAIVPLIRVNLKYVDLLYFN